MLILLSDYYSMHQMCWENYRCFIVWKKVNYHSYQCNLWSTPYVGLDMYREWKKTEFPRVLYMNLKTTRPRGRPRNRWLDEVREDGRMVGGEEWQEKVYDREEWKRLLRTARNYHILYMPMDWLIDWLIWNSNNNTETKLRTLGRAWLTN